MPISFTCPHCGSTTLVADEFAGHTGPCKQCGQMVSVPLPAGAIPPPMPPPPSPRSNWPWVLVTGIVLLCCCGGTLPALLLPAVQAAREAGRSNVCRNNLRNITLAMLQYEATHGKLPPAYVADENGKPMHSWRVMILPYLDQRALYDQYDFDEPWDGPNNSRLAIQMPEVFKCPTSPSALQTGYAVVTGPGLVFDGANAMPISQIARGDGLGSTLLIVECEGANIHWMEPRDLDIASTTPSSKHPNGMNVSFADGRVRFLRDDLPAGVYEGLLTPAGGEPINEDQLRN